MKISDPILYEPVCFLFSDPNTTYFQEHEVFLKPDGASCFSKKVVVSNIHQAMEQVTVVSL